MNPEGPRRALPSTVELALVGCVVIAAILGARHVWLRPRLSVHLSLRGTTRRGTLYVRVENAGQRIARDARIDVMWRGPRGEAHVERRELGDIEGKGAVLAPVRDLHAAIENAPDGWERIVVLARAENAASAEGSLPLGARSGEEAEPAVVYARLTRCPDAPDGKHVMRTTRVRNDDVVETWEVCARCRFVRRLPLTPEEEARQREVRRERAARLQRELEEEIERAATAGPRRRAPPKDDETFPLEVAFWVLGLDPARATWEDVQRAHRKLALQHHPDRARSEESETRMRDINRARDRLREHFENA